MIISVKTFHDWIVAIHESDCYTVMIYDASMKLLTSFVMDYGVDHGHMIAESSYVVTKDGYLVVMDSQNNLSCFSMIASSRWETWKRRWFGHSVLWRTPMDLTPIYPLSRSHSPFAWNMVEIYEPSRIGVAGFYYPIQIFDTMSGDRLLSIPVQSMILVAIQDTFFCREHREGNPRGVYMLRGEDVIYQCQSVEHFESIHHAASHGDLVVTISLSLLEMYYELPLRSQLLWSTKKSFYNISFSGNGRTLLCQSYGENQTWKMQIRLSRTGMILQVLEAGSACRLSPCVFPFDRYRGWKAYHNTCEKHPTVGKFVVPTKGFVKTRNIFAFEIVKISRQKKCLCTQQHFMNGLSCSVSFLFRNLWYIFMMRK